MRIDLDTRQFQKALNEYKDATGKDGADILNRAGRNVAFRAAQFTPVATAGAIKASLFKDPRLRYALAALAIRRSGKGSLKSPAFQTEVEKFVARRLASRRYLRAAWAKAIEQMGGSFRGSKFRGAGGSASPASLRDLVAVLVAETSQPDGAHARSAEKVGIKPLQDAIDFVAKDMIEYAQRKLAERARQHSAA